VSDHHARAAVRQSLIGSGIPPQFVDEIVDLAFRAAEEATEAILRVIARSGDKRAQMAAYGVAFGVTQARIAAMQETLTRVGGELGLLAKTVTVEVQA
jgi:hypothetical protein